jgi:hypothetical protein
MGRHTKGQNYHVHIFKARAGKKEELKVIFDITKRDNLFDVLFQNNVIRLKGGHTIPTT